MLIVAGYRGGPLDREIARVYNVCMSIRGFIAEKQVSPEEIRRLWFEYSTFDPEEFAMVVDNGRVYGLVFARVGMGFGRIWLCIDPWLPRHYLLETISYLLSWARHRLSRERVCVVKIGCGYEYSGFHCLLREVVGLGLENATVMLMEYSGGSRKYSVHPGIIVREGSMDDIPGVVEVWNSAFRRYSWFEEWRIEDALRWYSTRKLMLYVAVDRETNRVIGYVDAELRRGFDGNTYGYIYTLAVHPDMQGKGVGKTLLQYMVNILSRRGVKSIYLDAIHGLENYYARQGFRIISRSIVSIVEIGRLPSHTPSIMVINSDTK